MIEPPMRDDSGRIHDPIPRAVPENWGRETVEDALREVEESLRQRKKKIDEHLGPDYGHNERYRREVRWKKQLEERLEQLDRSQPVDLSKYTKPAAVGVGIGAVLWILWETVARLIPVRNLAP